MRSSDLNKRIVGILMVATNRPVHIGRRPDLLYALDRFRLRYIEYKPYTKSSAAPALFVI